MGAGAVVVANGSAGLALGVLVGRLAIVTIIIVVVPVRLIVCIDVTTTRTCKIVILITAYTDQIVVVCSEPAFFLGGAV
jgi:hypothetical protein